MDQTVKLDIPIKDLPFEAGKGFFATVKDGVAHVIITTTEQPLKAVQAGTSLTWAERAEKLAENIDRQALKKEAQTDERLAAILEKHAPELLD